MIYSKKDREKIKNRIVELLTEKGDMKFSEISSILIEENLARTPHIVSLTLQNCCKDDDKFKGEDLFVNLKFGMWGLSNK